MRRGRRDQVRWNKYDEGERTMIEEKSTTREIKQRSRETIRWGRKNQGRGKKYDEGERKKID
jgi:hypothetical protein